MTFANDHAYPQRPGKQECEHFMRTGFCRFGSTCKFHHPIEQSVPDTETALEMFANSEVAGEAAAFNSSQLPLRPGSQECAFYLRMGFCKYGAGCKFHHPERFLMYQQLTSSSQEPSPQSLLSRNMVQMVSAQTPVVPYMHNPPAWPYMQDSTTVSNAMPTPMLAYTMPGVMVGMQEMELEQLPQRDGEKDCSFYLKTGCCKFGATCKFHHPRDRQLAAEAAGIISPDLNASGLPIRLGETPCAFYLRTGICKFGASCKFDHPDDVILKQKFPPNVHQQASRHNIYSTLPGYGMPPHIMCPPCPPVPGAAAYRHHPYNQVGLNRTTPLVTSYAPIPLHGTTNSGNMHPILPSHMPLSHPSFQGAVLNPSVQATFHSSSPNSPPAHVPAPSFLSYSQGPLIASHSYVSNAVKPTPSTMNPPGDDVVLIATNGTVLSSRPAVNPTANGKLIPEGNKHHCDPSAAENREPSATDETSTENGVAVPQSKSDYQEIINLSCSNNSTNLQQIASSSSKISSVEISQDMKEANGNGNYHPVANGV